MSTPSLRNLFAFLLFALLGFVLAGGARADPPSRVARIAYVSGAASFSPGGERDWGRAIVNRPMITGDRLWVERGARAELQLGSAAIRVGGATSLTLLNLDDRTAQVQLDQGTLNIRVRRLDRGQVFEVDTPNLAFSIRRPGRYRINVDADGDATMVTVRSGLAEVYGPGRAFVVGERLTYRFYGTGLRDYETFALLPVDEFERWSGERDRRWDNSVSRRYVSPELIGYDDLDQYGTWRKVSDYGFVWVPSRVPAGWAPYREGHWAWVEPWGWTWIDEAPWGFAPSHYGRWAYVDRTWAWVPGPATARPGVCTRAGCVRRIGRRAGAGRLCRGDRGLVPAGPARGVPAVLFGQPRVLRQRQHQQHGRQQDRGDQRVQQHERHERHLRQPADPGRRRGGAGGGVLAIQAGGQGDRARDPRDGRQRAGDARGAGRARACERGRPGRGGAQRKTAGARAGAAGRGPGGAAAAAGAVRSQAERARRECRQAARSGRAGSAQTGRTGVRCRARREGGGGDQARGRARQAGQWRGFGARASQGAGVGNCGRTGTCTCARTGASSRIGAKSGTAVSGLRTAGAGRERARHSRRSQAAVRRGERQAAARRGAEHA